MRLEKQGGYYVAISDFNERFLPKQAGFDWDAEKMQWKTDSPYVASELAEYAEGELNSALIDVRNIYNGNINENGPVVDSDAFYSPTGRSLYPFQKNGIAWLIGRKYSMLADEMGCIAGNATIGITINGRMDYLTIEELYHSFHYDIPTYTRSVIDRKLQVNRIVDVKVSGTKHVIHIVTESGNELSLTPDHEILSVDGQWIEAQRLSVRDKVSIAIDNSDEPLLDGIISIYPGNLVDTYDLVMEDPGRNFVANGIIVHNCGKTVQAIGVINHSDPPIDRVLVVCPASLRLNWKYELETWLRDPRSIAIVDSKMGWAHLADIIIINYDILHKFYHELRDQEWDLMIVDEAHYCRNPRAKRTQQLFGKKWRYSRKQEWELTPIPANRKILITGTPIVNRPVELWPLAHALDPVTFSSYDKFTRRYCNARRGRWGWDVSGASNLDELRKILRATIMIRRKKDDVLDELPPKVMSVVELPHNGSIKAVKAELTAFQKHETALQELIVTRELAKTLDTEENYVHSIKQLKSGLAVAFNQLAVERKRVALAKVKMITEYIDNVIDEKVVLFCHHRDVIHQYVKHFGKSCVWLNGERSLEDRQDAVDRFQNDPNIKVFIGSIQAAGVGITLTSARIALFSELDWTPGNMEQASDRLHRIGQNDTVVIQYLVFDQSVDARIAKTLVEKQAVIRQSLDSMSDDNDIIPLPFKELPTTIDLSYRDVERESLSVTDEDKDMIWSALHNLSLTGKDELNEFDKIILDNLLVARYLSNKEAIIGRKLLSKHRQIESSKRAKQSLLALKQKHQQHQQHQQ